MDYTLTHLIMNHYQVVVIFHYQKKKLGNSMKGLINLKNKDHKCFMWCHVRLINPTNSHPERINKQDKKIAANLNYSDIVFPLDINNYEKIEDRFQM